MATASSSTRTLRPYDDQWAFLSSLPRLSADAASQIVADAEMRGRVLGVRMPVEDEDADEPWRMTPSRRREPGTDQRSPAGQDRHRHRRSDLY